MTMRYEVHRYEIVTADDGEPLIRAVPVTQADWDGETKDAERWRAAEPLLREMDDELAKGEAEEEECCWCFYPLPAHHASCTLARLVALTDDPQNATEDPA